MPDFGRVLDSCETCLFFSLTIKLRVPVWAYQWHIAHINNQDGGVDLIYCYVFNLTSRPLLFWDSCGKTLSIGIELLCLGQKSNNSNLWCCTDILTLIHVYSRKAIKERLFLALITSVCQIIFKYEVTVCLVGKCTYDLTDWSSDQLKTALLADLF